MGKCLHGRVVSIYAACLFALSCHGVGLLDRSAIQSDRVTHTESIALQQEFEPLLIGQTPERAREILEERGYLVLGGKGKEEEGWFESLCKRKVSSADSTLVLLVASHFHAEDEREGDIVVVSCEPIQSQECKVTAVHALQRK